ncbi:MAG: hypothetical protein KAI69_05745 [Deltaproteobacteria bacterium]|nr:hypothetical protein [Deltaproteobacteria bacterium]
MNTIVVSARKPAAAPAIADEIVRLYLFDRCGFLGYIVSEKGVNNEKYN